MSEQLYNYDHEELENYLHTHVDGFEKLDVIEKFSDGQSNPSFLLRSDQYKFVLRAKPPGVLLPSAHAVDREFRIMSALGQTNLAVPKMYHLATDDSPLGVMFFVMEYVEGRIFWDPCLPDLDKETRRALYLEMASNMARLHQIDPHKIGLSDYGKPGSYFMRQTHRWTKQYRAGVITPSDDVDYVIDWLMERLTDTDDSTAIAHGDYRMDNMIFDAQSVEIRALLDWELSTLGNPLADLAYQCMQLRFPHQGLVKGIKGMDREELGIPLEEDYKAHYCTARGIGEIENWNFYLVFSYFRMIAILEGVMRRAIDGNASNPRSLDAMAAANKILAQDARDLTH